MSLDITSTIVGGAIATTASVLLHFLNRRHQDAIQQNEMAVRLAIEKAKIDHATQEFMNTRRSDGVTIMNDPRVDIILCEMLEFTDKLRRHRRSQQWQRIKDWLGCEW